MRDSGFNRYLNRTKPPAGYQLDYSHPLVRGLVGCWLFNEGAGDKIVNLASGIAAPKVGTPVWSKGQFGPALTFPSGSGSYYAVPFEQRLNIGFLTIAAWIRSVSTTTTTNFIDRDTESGPNRIFQFRLTTGSTLLHFVPFFSASPVTTFIGTTTLNDGRWHHVAAVLDGINCRLYVDGKIDFTVAETRAMDSGGTAGYRIGAHSDAGATSVFDGSVDEVLVWNRGLSQAEIQLLYRSPFDFITSAPRSSLLAGSAPSVPTLDTWYRPIIQPLALGRPRSQGTQFVVPLSEDAGFVEGFGLDKWFMPTSQPLPKRKGVLDTPQFLVVDLPNIPSSVALDWMPPTSRPLVQKLSRITPVSHSLFVAPALVVRDGVVVLVDLVNENLR